MTSPHVPRVYSLLDALTALLDEVLTQLMLFFVSEVLEQVNENHPEKARYAQQVPSLLKLVNSLVTNKLSQAQALDTLYDVIIQGDCLRGNWKPIVSALKVSPRTPCHL